MAVNTENTSAGPCISGEDGSWEKRNGTALEIWRQDLRDPKEKAPGEEVNYTIGNSGYRTAIIMMFTNFVRCVIVSISLCHISVRCEAYQE